MKILEELTFFYLDFNFFRRSCFSFSIFWWIFEIDEEFSLTGELRNNRRSQSTDKRLAQLVASVSLSVVLFVRRCFGPDRNIDAGVHKLPWKIVADVRSGWCAMFGQYNDPGAESRPRGRRLVSARASAISTQIFPVCGFVDSRRDARGRREIRE